MKPKILATSWHPGGINAIIPVVKRLADEGKVEVITVGHEFSEKILEAQAVPYATISNYGLTDVSLESMLSLLDKISPDLVLTGTSVQDEKNPDVIEQTVTLAGKERNIPTLSVLDFWENYSLRFSDKFKAEKHKFLPSKIAIMDQYAKSDMLREGFDESRLVVTGNPNFDDLESKARNYTDKARVQLRSKINVASELMVFYAANAWKKDKMEFGFWDLDNIVLINEALQDISSENSRKYAVAVKLHPRAPKEDVAEVKDYLDSSANGKIVLVTDVHPHELVLASDLVLTPFSTLAVEAVYMGKPCISMQPNLAARDYLKILTGNNIIPVGYTPDDSKALVKKALSDSNYRQKTLPRQASQFRTDGRATERVADLVYKMTGLIDVS